MAVQCSEASSCDVNDGNIGGSWDILFRESLVVELDNQMRFVANLKYTARQNGQDAPTPAYMQSSEYKDWRNGDYDRFDSQCDQTMAGFV